MVIPRQFVIISVDMMELYSFHYQHAQCFRVLPTAYSKMAHPEHNHDNNIKHFCTKYSFKNEVQFNKFILQVYDHHET